MLEDNKGNVPKAGNTKHAIKLTKEQYAILLSRLLNRQSQDASDLGTSVMQGTPQPMEQGRPAGPPPQAPNPFQGLPQGGAPGEMASMRMQMPGGMPSPPMPRTPQMGQADPRLQALLQQMQGVRPPPMPGNPGMRSLEEIMRGGR